LPPLGSNPRAAIREVPIIAGGARFRRPGASKPRAVLIWEIGVAKTTSKQLSKIQQQKAALRRSLWPNLDDKTLWDWRTSDGWLNVPRAMPLLLQIMDRMSNGKPVSATYLDLWFRTYDDGFVVASSHRQMAFYSGFTGERAEHTWASRVRILAELGFIEVKSGPNGPISYILIRNPYQVVKRHRDASRVDERSFNALMERMIEIRATDLDAAAASAEAAK
jgi:hypothetical protein